MTERPLPIQAPTWTHDICGGKVDTSGLYWKCERCGQFVWVYCCNGNSIGNYEVTLKRIKEA